MANPASDAVDEQGRVPHGLGVRWQAVRRMAVRYSKTAALQSTVFSSALQDQHAEMVRIGRGRPRSQAMRGKGSDQGFPLEGNQSEE